MDSNERKILQELVTALGSVIPATDGYEPRTNLWNKYTAAKNMLSAAPQVVVDDRPAVVYPPDGTVSPFTVINLGHGLVKMGDSLHDGRLPALWFGKDGLGMGVAEEMNRAAKEGETLAVVTFSNVDGLDVLAEVVQRIRAVAFPAAPLQAQEQWIDKLTYGAQVDEWAIEKSNLEREIEVLKSRAPVQPVAVPDGWKLASEAIKSAIYGITGPGFLVRLDELDIAKIISDEIPFCAAPAAQGDTITLTRDELVDHRNQALEQGVCEGKDPAAQGDKK